MSRSVLVAGTSSDLSNSHCLAGDEPLNGFHRLAGFAEGREEHSLLALRIRLDIEPLHDPGLVIATGIPASIHRAKRRDTGGDLPDLLADQAQEFTRYDGERIQSGASQAHKAQLKGNRDPIFRPELLSNRGDVRREKLEEFEFEYRQRRRELADSEKTVLSVCHPCSAHGPPGSAETSTANALRPRKP